MIDKDCGVLLVGHGTRDKVGTAQFFELASLLADQLDPVPVEAGLLEFQQPTIAQAWDALVSRHVKRVRVAPLLLFAAGHAKQDIPDVLQECQSKDPGIRFDQTRPLSRHPAMIELARCRLKQSLSQATAVPNRTAVVMVGRGSYDPCAQADMRVLAEVVGRGADVASVVTAFYAMANPRLPIVLDELAGSRQVDTIVVQPHLLFEGRLYQAILGQIEEARRQHPTIQWVNSDYLGPDRLVARAIAGRLAEA